MGIIALLILLMVAFFPLVRAWIFFERIIQKRRDEAYKRKLEIEISNKIRNKDYDHVYKISDNVFMVNVGSYSMGTPLGGKTFDSGKTGFIDSAGNILIPLKYDTAFAYKEEYGGLIKVLIFEKGFGLVDRKGNEIFPCEFHLEYLNCELWIIEKNNKKGVLDKSGVILADIVYDNVCVFFFYKPINMNISYAAGVVRDKPCIGVMLNEKVGVVSYEGDIILPVCYDSITIISNTSFIVCKGEMNALFDIKGNELIPFCMCNIKSVTDLIVSIEYSNGYRIALTNGEFLDDRLYEGVIESKSARNTVSLCYNGKWGVYKFYSRSEGDYINESEGWIPYLRSVGILSSLRDSMWIEVIPFEYDEIGAETHMEKVTLRKEEKYGVVDFKGRILAEFVYETSQKASDAAITKYNIEWRKYMKGDKSFFS